MSSWQYCCYKNLWCCQKIASGQFSLFFHWIFSVASQKLKITNHLFHVFCVWHDFNDSSVRSRRRDVVWQSVAVCTCLQVWYGHRMFSGSDTNVTSSTFKQIYRHPWCHYEVLLVTNDTHIARFTGPTWGPSGADRTQVGPMLAPWTIWDLFVSQIAQRLRSTSIMHWLEVELISNGHQLEGLCHLGI